jgi:hypothetical protein
VNSLPTRVMLPGILGLICENLFLNAAHTHAHTYPFKGGYGVCAHSKSICAHTVCHVRFEANRIPKVTHIVCGETFMGSFNIIHDNKLISGSGYLW